MHVLLVGLQWDLVVLPPLRVAFWATLRAGALRMLLVRLRWGLVLLPPLGVAGRATPRDDPGTRPRRSLASSGSDARALGGGRRGCAEGRQGSERGPKGGPGGVWGRARTRESLLPGTE